MATKKDRFITCELIAVWPKLDEVDVYKPKKGPEVRKYRTNAKAAPGHEAKFKAMYDMIVKYASDHLPDVDEPQLPFKPEKDKDKKETGVLLLSATSGEKYRPPVFDAKNRKVPEDVKIGGGSRIRLDLALNTYEDKNGGGVNLYINGVQLLDLVEKGVGKSNFDEADGYEFDGETSAPKSGFGVESKTSDDPLAF